jgi:hypothetical protein
MLIGICGAPGAGKDTLANQLVSFDVYEKYRFADPLKAMLAQFHIKPDVWEDQDAKERTIPWLGKSPRFLAQTLGTEWGRDLVHRDIWVLMAKGRWNVLNAAGAGRMVISDVRFLNEAQWIKEAGGILIRVCRDGTENVGRAYHRSEADRETMDFENLVFANVLNEGKPEEARESLWNAVKLWTERGKK